MREVKRGDIYYADLNPVMGCEQGGIRPVIILQNDIGNQHSPTVIAAAITSKTAKAPLPTHITLCGGSCGLPQDSIVLLEQVRTLDKCRLLEYVGRASEEKLGEVDKALQISFGLCSTATEHNV